MPEGMPVVDLVLGAPVGGSRPRPLDHGTGSRSQILIEATSTVSAKMYDVSVPDPTCSYYFLWECNSAGQWGWIAEETGLLIADELVGAA